MSLRTVLRTCSDWIVAAGICCCVAAASGADRRAAAVGAKPSDSQRSTPEKSRPFSADRLVRVFKATREEPRLKALLEVEQFHLGNPALPAALWEAIDHNVRAGHIALSLVRATDLYCRLDDPAEREHQLSLLSADARLALVSATVLAERGVSEALPGISRLRERSEYAARYAFRHAVVSAVARFSDAASVKFLVATVSDSDGQLKFEAARHLAQLTGENFGGHAARWRKWWTEHEDGYVVDEARRAGAADLAPTSLQPLPWDGALPTFYGTPVYARRILFVIDQSRSMLSTVDDVTRLEEAQKELEGTIRNLAGNSEFDILAYNTGLTLFKDRLVPATAQARSEAIRFTYSLVADGKTACYDALEDAILLDDNLEAILFLSDGEPTAGKVIDRLRIVQSITQLNLLRRISISTIGIDTTAQDEDFLKKLAAANFGTYKSIR